MIDVLLLYNEPLLPEDHRDAESEHTVVDVAKYIGEILGTNGYAPRLFGLGQNPADLLRELDARRPDVIVNLFEGNPDNTETESYVAGLLEWKGIPFTGSPMRALCLCRPKHLAKLLLKGAGLPTAGFFVIDQLPVPESPLEFPVIAKLACQDASVGIDQTSVCTNQAELENRVDYLMREYGPPIMIEEYISGREINVALLELPELEYLPPAEILFPEEKPGQWAIVTYPAKWDPDHIDYKTTPPKFPADLPPRLAKKVGELAVKAYRTVGCRDYARVDFRIRNGKPYILEVNPNPEISDEAGFAHSLASANLVYIDFILRLVDNARKRAAAPPPALQPERSDAPAALTS